MTEETTTTTESIVPLSIPEGRYIEGIGRRKTATARVRVSAADNDAVFTINGKDIATYFPTEEMQGITTDALAKAKGAGKVSISVHVNGGGIHAQAEAIRHGLSRALVALDEELRRRFKKAGLLKRDSRMKERKKFGKKKARKSAQWSKR